MNVDYFVFDETTYIDDEVYNHQVFIVDTSKIEKFASEFETEFQYGYVQHLIEAAKRGSTHEYTSRKYSFGDCTGWYDKLTVDKVPEGKTSHTLYVEINIGF